MEEGTELEGPMFATCCDLGRKRSSTSVHSSSRVSKKSRPRKMRETHSSRARRPKSKKSHRRSRRKWRHAYKRKLTKEEEIELNREFELWKKYKEWRKLTTKERQVEMTTMKSEGFDISVPLRPLSPCSSSSSFASETSLGWDPELYLRVSSLGYGTPHWGQVCVKRRPKIKRHRELSKRKKVTPSNYSLDRKISEPGVPGISFTNIPGFNVPGFGGPGLARPWFWSPSITSLSIQSASGSVQSLSNEEPLPEHTSFFRDASIGSCTSLFSETKFPQWIPLDDEVEERDEIELWPKKLQLVMHVKPSSTDRRVEAADSGSTSRNEEKSASSIHPTEETEKPESDETDVLRPPGDGDEVKKEAESKDETLESDITTIDDSTVEDYEQCLVQFSDDDESIDTHVSDSSSARHKYRWMPIVEDRKDFWTCNREAAHSGFSTSGSCDSEIDRLSIAMSDSPSAEKSIPTPPYKMKENVSISAPEPDTTGGRPPPSSTPLDNISSVYRAEVRRLRAIGQGMDPGTAGASKAGAGEVPPGEEEGPREMTAIDLENRFLEEVAHQYLGPNRRAFIDTFKGDRNAFLRTSDGDLLVVDLNVLKKLDLYALHMEAIGERNFQKMIHQLPPVNLAYIMRVLLWCTYFQEPTRKPKRAPSESSEDETDSDPFGSSEEPTPPKAPTPQEESTSSDSSSTTKKPKKRKRPRKKRTPSSKRSTGSPHQSAKTSRQSKRTTPTSSKGSKKGSRKRSTRFKREEVDPEKLEMARQLIPGMPMGAISKLIIVADVLGARDLEKALLQLTGRSTAKLKESELRAMFDYTREGVWLPKLLSRLKEEVPDDDHCVVPYADAYDLDRIGSLRGLTRRGSKRSSVESSEGYSSQVSLPSFQIILEPNDAKRTDSQQGAGSVQRTGSLERTSSVHRMGSGTEAQDSGKKGKRSSLLRKEDEPSGSRRVSSQKEAGKGKRSTRWTKEKRDSRFPRGRKKSRLSRRSSGGRRSSKTKRGKAKKGRKLSSERGQPRKLFTLIPVSAGLAHRIGKGPYALQPVSAAHAIGRGLDGMQPTSGVQFAGPPHVFHFPTSESGEYSKPTDSDSQFVDSTSLDSAQNMRELEEEGGQELEEEGGQELEEEGEEINLMKVDKSSQFPDGSQQMEDGKYPEGLEPSEEGKVLPDGGRYPYGQKDSGDYEDGEQPGTKGYGPKGPHRGRYPYGSQYPGGGWYPRGAQYPGGGRYPRGAQYPGDGRYPRGAQYPGGGRYPRGSQYPDGRYPYGSQYPDGRYPFGSQYPDGRYPYGSQYPDDGRYPYGSQYPDGGRYPYGSQYPDGGQYPYGSQFSDSEEYPYGQYGAGIQFPSGKPIGQFTPQTVAGGQDAGLDTSEFNTIHRIGEVPYALQLVSGGLLSGEPQLLGYDAAHPSTSQLSGEQDIVSAEEMEEHEEEHVIDDYDTFLRKKICPYICPNLSKLRRKRYGGRSAQSNRIQDQARTEQRSRTDSTGRQYWSQPSLREGAFAEHYKNTMANLSEAIDCRLGGKYRHSKHSKE